MTHDIRDWLPDAAFTGDAVKAVLQSVIDAWAAMWFPARPVTPARSVTMSRVRTGRSKTLASADTVQSRGTFAIVELSDSGRHRLLEAALDTQFSGQPLLESDRALLELFASKAVENLIGRLDAAFGKASGGDGARVGFALLLSGEEILSVGVPQHVLVPFIKERLGGPRRGRTSLRARQKALGPTHVNAKGVLGRADLAVDDLKGLAQGDVLVLDRALHETVELRLNPSNQSVGRGRLGRKDGRVSIQF